MAGRPLRRARLNRKARRNAFLRTPQDLAEDNGFIVNGGFVSHRDPMITILFVEKERVGHRLAGSRGKRGLVIIRSALIQPHGGKSAVQGEFIPEGWDHPEVEEWARLNPGVREARGNPSYAVVLDDGSEAYERIYTGPGRWHWGLRIFSTDKVYEVGEIIYMIEPFGIESEYEVVEAPSGWSQARSERGKVRRVK
tara:strand:+ start:770 stop:1357 length:588 start_codon:yes stop_codon:yes gene_type:complete